jgi:hypothetical protein
MTDYTALTVLFKHTYLSNESFPIMELVTSLGPYGIGYSFQTVITEAFGGFRVFREFYSLVGAAINETDINPQMTRDVKFSCEPIFHL